MLTSELLRQAGEALYGERWQTGLALDLDVNDRTMRRWATGESAIPERIAMQLRELLEKRTTTIEAVVRKLPR